MSSLAVVAIIFLLGNFLFPLDTVQATPYKHLGCYKDSWKARALPDFLGRFPKRLAVKKCSDLAKKGGYTTFAVQNGGDCFSGISADHTYNMYGRSKNCQGGVGGSWANDVFQFPLYILLKKLRDNYKSLRAKSILLQAKSILHDRKLESLQQRYQSLSNKEQSLEHRLSALNQRVSRTRARVSCINKATAWRWQPYSRTPLGYLDRHHVNCPQNYFVAGFRLIRSGDKADSPLRYNYRCCKLVL